jgi:hypothetical protein
VRRFRNICFALAALLWLPVSAHCQLETLPGFEFLRCSAEGVSTGDSSKHDCSNCCTVEKSQCHSSQGRLIVSAPTLFLIPMAPAPETQHSLPAEVSLGVLTAAPPEKPTSWHFILRTALPVRAPSFVS